jgi:hypothetical protein
MARPARRKASAMVSVTALFTGLSVALRKTTLRPS